MAICRTCNSETLRVITTVSKVSGEFVDQCPNCSPETFAGEKVSDPSTKKMWMGWEVDAAHYTKTEDGYQASDSVLADLEAAVMREDADDVAMREKVLRERREYAARHRTPETAEQRAINDEAARNLVKECEMKASLMSQGIILPENL